MTNSNNMCVLRWVVVGDVLRWLAANTTKRLDIIAQYWQLLASPNDPRSGDYGYTQHQMHKFGAHQGAALYQALDAAADRNVSIRCAFNFRLYQMGSCLNLN